MIRNATEAGVEIMVSPYFNFISANATGYAQALADGVLATSGDSESGPAQGIGQTAMYDVFTPAARARMMKSAVSAAGSYGAVGVRNWWLDCQEPCQSPGMSTAIWGGKAAMPHAAVGAAYPHLLAEATRGAMTNGTVMLGRSAWAGTQRFGAAVWSGDTDSSWLALRQQVRAGLNAQMSGITYWTSDIGGYAGGGGGPQGKGFDHNIHSKAFLQLLTRWFQVCCWLCGAVRALHACAVACADCSSIVWRVLPSVPVARPQAADAAARGLPGLRRFRIVQRSLAL